MEEYNNNISFQVYDYNKDIATELGKIHKDLEEIKEVNMLITNQLSIQNEKLDNISTLTETNNQILVNSNNNLKIIDESLKKDTNTKYLFLSIITGAILLPISVKMGASVIASSLILSKIRK